MFEESRNVKMCGEVTEMNCQCMCCLKIISNENKEKILLPQPVRMASKCNKEALNVYAPLVMVSI